jgi:lipopolysaccharide transport system permease protein/teichoic acid transport system permease protein
VRLLFHFLFEIFEHRLVINKLALTECRKKYLGSYLGIFWAFAQPVITIFIFWFVFELGFKSTPIHDFPFILWLSAAFVPWFFISDAILGGTNSILEQKFLVDKINFRISMLPIIKIVSAFYIQLIFTIFLIILYAIYGFYPTLYFIQIPYYLFCIFVLTTAITWITSALIIFIRDIGEVVGILVQFGFWLTPIFWPLKILPEEFHGIVTASPFYYIIHGYRNTFIYHKWFWESPYELCSFWLFTIVLLIISIFVFRKLRPHFADII